MQFFHWIRPGASADVYVCVWETVSTACEIFSESDPPLDNLLNTKLTQRYNFTLAIFILHAHKHIATFFPLFSWTVLLFFVSFLLFVVDVFHCYCFFLLYILMFLFDFSVFFFLYILRSFSFDPYSEITTKNGRKTSKTILLFVF